MKQDIPQVLKQHLQLAAQARKTVLECIQLNAVFFLREKIAGELEKNTDIIQLNNNLEDTNTTNELCCLALLKTVQLCKESQFPTNVVDRSWA